MFAIYSNKLKKFYVNKTAGREYFNKFGTPLFKQADKYNWTDNPAEGLSFKQEYMADQFAELIAEDLADWGIDADLTTREIV